MTDAAHLETVRALVREGDTSERAAAEARHVLAVTLYHVTKGRSRRWEIPAERVAAAGPGVAAIEWNVTPAGGLVVTLTAEEERGGVSD